MVAACKFVKFKQDISVSAGIALSEYVTDIGHDSIIVQFVLDCSIGEWDVRNKQPIGEKITIQTACFEWQCNKQG